MINYECLAIEANQQLVKEGKEPLYVVYLRNGLAVADSPLAFAKKGDAAKEELFKGLQSYLESPDVQKRIQATGRRAGGLGLTINSPDPEVFNPEWGISTSKLLVPIRMPQQEVVAQALDLYQTAFRKPSATVWCLDFSGSMQGDASDELKAAMGMILNQDQARKSLLQAAPNDYNVIIPFSDHILTTLQATGNNPTVLHGLSNKVNALAPDGGTDIYTPVAQGINLLAKQKNIEKSLPAIVLLTDGESNSGSIEEVRQALTKNHLDGKVAVYSITFGSANPEQLNSLAELTSGKVFDSKAGLIDAFRKVKGYN
jgi:Ca-activated chloride channel family protein